MFHLLTVATHSENMHEILLESAKRYKHDIKVLGKNKSYTSHRQKDIWVYEAIQDMPANDIVCFCDGFDSIICANSKDILHNFKKKNVDMLISIDGKDLNWSFNPFWCYAYSRVFSKKGVSYINCGMYIGYVCFLKKWLHKCIHSDIRTRSNQYIWSKHLKNIEYIDSNNDIFYNDMPIFSKGTLTVQDNKVYNNHKRVLVISFPGNQSATSLIKKLGYTSKIIVDNNWSLKKISFYFHHHYLFEKVMIGLFLFLGSFNFIYVMPVFLFFILIFALFLSFKRKIKTIA